MHVDEPAIKRVKLELKDTDFDSFMTQMERENSAGLDAQINDIFDEFNDIILANHMKTNIASETSPNDLSPFEPNEHTNSSITSTEEVPLKKQPAPQEDTINPATVFSLKKAMADTSRLIGTFTTLKTTYLKLCKEFNYLLSKFNENEKIKIELIHENNQLRKLLVDTIKEKELDRKKYKTDLDKLRCS